MAFCYKDQIKRNIEITDNAEIIYLQVEKELKRLNSLVRRKKVKDTYIGNSVFKIIRGEINDKELELYANDHFTAAYYSFIDIREKLTAAGKFDEVGIKSYGFIISNLLYDMLPFAEFIGQKENAKYCFFKGYKATIEDSHWHYMGSFQLLYNCTYDYNMLDNKFAYILSPVALRQALELKIQRIIGVGDYYDGKGEKIFTRHYYFFDFIKKYKAHFDFQDVDFGIIQKVFEFCNLSVHKGIMPYYWQMSYAIKFCDPLFFDNNPPENGSFHFHSSIKVYNYDELKLAFIRELTSQFPSPKYDLRIHWIKPEAMILMEKNENG